MKIRYLLFVGLLMLMPFFALAKSYDFYVDQAAKSGGDGSKDKPFQTIKEAIEEAEKEGGSQQIYIEYGKYSGGFTVGKAITLVGESESKVTIAGTVEMKDDSKLERVTVKGGNRGIAVVKNASVEIENCTVRDFEKIGIDIAAGSGKLTLVNSKIKDGKGKGVYVQRGNKIEFIGNEIVENDEEGFDLRSKIRGSIKDNYIYKNGESGIELIVSEADLVISNNNIKSNGASGIAAQFYQELNKKGDIKVAGNKIAYNHSYALVCKKTKGGSTSAGYWKDSLKLSGNSLSGNKKGSVYKLCHLETETETATTERKEDRQEENEQAKRIAEEKEEQERLAKEAEKRAVERLKRQQEAEGIFTQALEDTKATEIELANIKQRSKLKTFFFGADQKEITLTVAKLQQQQQQLEEAQKILGEDYAQLPAGPALEGKIKQQLEKVGKQQQYLQQQKESVGLFGWFKKLFGF